MKHYRVKTMYSVDPFTGWPDNMYHVQVRTSRKSGDDDEDGWDNLLDGVYTVAQEAKDRVEELRREALRERKEEIGERRANMRRMSGAMRSEVE